MSRVYCHQIIFNLKYLIIRYRHCSYWFISFLFFLISWLSLLICWIFSNLKKEEFNIRGELNILESIHLGATTTTWNLYHQGAQCYHPGNINGEKKLWLAWRLESLVQSRATFWILISNRNLMGELNIYNPISSNRWSRGAHLNPSHCLLIFPAMALKSHVVEHLHRNLSLG